MKQLGKMCVMFLLITGLFLGALWVCSLLEGSLQGLHRPVVQILQENNEYFALWRLLCGVLLFCVWPSFIRVCAKRQGWPDALCQTRIEWRWSLAVCFVVMDVVFVEHVFRIFL